MIERLRSRSQFDALRSSGRRIRAGSLRCTFLPDPDATATAVAFAVPRSSGTAVRRNRFRRRARSLLSEVDLPTGLLLIRGDHRAVERTFLELRDDTRLLERRLRSIDPSPSSAPSNDR